MMGVVGERYFEIGTPGCMMREERRTKTIIRSLSCLDVQVSISVCFSRSMFANAVDIAPQYLH